MSRSRTSLETTSEQEKHLESARALQETIDKADLKLQSYAKDFRTHKVEVDGEEVHLKDPAIVASDVAAQMSYLRKLKFQFWEQSAKDKYVKTIVSDIDDALIVNTDDNNEIFSKNEQKKALLKEAKAKRAEVQENVRILAPLVEEDYDRIKKMTEKANVLAQKIIDARLRLTRLRQTHPQPRLTILLADQKLTEQVEQMQSLSDEAQAISEKIQSMKDKVKNSNAELEKLRTERAEAEKAVKIAKVDEDEAKLMPLYDWYMAALKLHRWIHDLHHTQTVSENELRLTYNVALPSEKAILITIALIFAPDTRHLAAVQVTEAEELEIELGDTIDVHIQSNDVHGLIAAILSQYRTGLALRAL
ncbi:hypothetical protein AMATHDRAFT_64154 [Amanita thiersii Skay4041]|uniref:Kinetochore protein Sos7 coiled-coil domain-containing protein n=1 Tax=Amanita thiersii Skay4041 TaxID=703135 RepID=A0A2A9NMP7_9AGAR|nr:hypothetical protein AMATHDRAFT_64154 [Amanita thiersii Skay4041]